VRLSSILDPGCVLLDVGGGSKADVLARLAAPIARRRSDLDGTALLAELVRREEESSTAIADGIAIPHARPACRPEVTAAFGRAPSGVDFDSLDGRPTRLLFVVISPASEPELHGRWLAHIARVLSDPATRAALLEASSEAEVLDVLRHREEAIEATEPVAAKAAR
jgi:mannitol/fructose-specific phosphotransferase system IIA component (Ntr-type)